MTTANLNSLSGSTQSWTLDGVGNQTAVNTSGTNVNRTSNSQNELTADGSASLAYDNDGNTTTDENGHTLTYNAWNQLIATKSGGTTLQTYGYDALGRRISENSGTATDLYVSSQNQVLEERQGTAVTAQNIWNLDYVNDLALRDTFSQAGTGALDTSFNSTGKKVINLGSYDYVVKTLTQRDGKIIVCGFSYIPGITSYIERLNTDGSLDTTFGSSGVVSFSSSRFPNDAVLDSNGNIDVVGASGSTALTVWRITSSGSFDSTFGTSGEVVVSGANQGYGIAIQSDGKILASGLGTSFQSVVVRLTTTGSLDTTFGTSGIVNLSSISTSNWANAVMVQSSGAIVLLIHDSTNSRSDLLRLTSSGSIDTTFGSSGTTTLGSYANAFVADPFVNGDVLVAGENSGLTSGQVWRFTANGTLDTTFGSSGIASISGSAELNGITVQPDGKILAVGETGSGTSSNWIVARLNPSGSLDTTFGTSGTFVTWFGGSSGAEEDQAESVAIEPTGGIVVAGNVDASSAANWGIIRLSSGLSRSYFQHDADYNITAAVDATGNVTQRYIYSAYGVQTVLTSAWATTSASNSLYGFQGGRFDIANGFNYYDARNYDPNTAVWIERDPTVYGDGMDGYQGFGSNPVAYSDPTGFEAEIEVSENTPIKNIIGIVGRHWNFGDTYFDNGRFTVYVKKNGTGYCISGATDHATIKTFLVNLQGILILNFNGLPEGEATEAQIAAAKETLNTVTKYEATNASRLKKSWDDAAAVADAALKNIPPGTKDGITSAAQKIVDEAIKSVAADALVALNIDRHNQHPPQDARPAGSLDASYARLIKLEVVEGEPPTTLPATKPATMPS